MTADPLVAQLRAHPAHRPASPLRRATGLAGRALLAFAITACLSVGTLQAVQADPEGAPSKEDVRKAQQRADDKAVQVARIRAELAAADARARAAQVQAEIAAEDYNDARTRLEIATAKAKKAQRKATRAQAEVESRRALAGRFAAASYQGAGDLDAVGSMFSATGPQSLLDAMATRTMVDNTLAGAYAQYQAAQTVAKLAQERAAQARKQQAEATAAKEAAYDQASAAADQATAVAASVEQQKNALVAELARLQDISVKLAEQRQRALEEEARRKAEERARKKAEEEARKKREQEKREREKKEREKREREKKEREKRDRDRDRKAPDPAPQPDPEPEPDPEPDPEPQPGPSGGDPSQSQINTAIAYAKAQLGEPYVFGGAGPNVWDCSGLTMKAWAAAGIYFYHGARMQYYNSKHISYGELQPGDLIYWAYNSYDPGSIHHVGMYLGNGMLINAPHTGDVVRIVSISYMGTPQFFSRPQN